MAPVTGMLVKIAIMLYIMTVFTQPKTGMQVPIVLPLRSCLHSANSDEQLKNGGRKHQCALALLDH